MQVCGVRAAKAIRITIRAFRLAIFSGIQFSAARIFDQVAVFVLCFWKILGINVVEQRDLQSIANVRAESGPRIVNTGLCYHLRLVHLGAFISFIGAQFIRSTLRWRAVRIGAIHIQVRNEAVFAMHAQHRMQDPIGAGRDFAWVYQLFP